MFPAWFSLQKQCYQDGKPRPKTDGTYESVPISQQTWHNRKDHFGDRNMCQKPNSRNQSNGKRNKVQNNNKYDGQKNQGARGKSHRPRFMSKGGNRKHNNQVSETLR